MMYLDPHASTSSPASEQSCTLLPGEELLKDLNIEIFEHLVGDKIETAVPYDPAGLISTVSFISPERNAVMALAYVPKKSSIRS